MKLSKLEEIEKNTIIATLENWSHDRQKAAKELGISLTKIDTLIDKYQIGMHKAVASALNDTSLSDDDKQAIMQIFGQVESVVIEKPKRTKKRYYKSNKKYYKHTSNYRKKYYDLLKKYMKIID